MGEFDLIRRYFTREPSNRTGVVLGVGDDCALLNPAPGQQLAISTDLLVEGHHFLSTVRPQRLGHKALAVNLSDLAACGAQPLAFTLALSLPKVDEVFLAGFAQGLHRLADLQRIDLVGGDTTAGPLSICITVFGQVPNGQALLRSGARPGDDLWVSGSLGDARLALEVFRGTQSLASEGFAQARMAMELPQPRVALGLALRGVASSAIDVSDGLLGDLGHILTRSTQAAGQALGAQVWLDALPRSPLMSQQSADVQRLCLLTGGDDYELAFTAPPQQRQAVEAAGKLAQTSVTRCGSITASPGLVVTDGQGQALDPQLMRELKAFDHFAS